MNSLADNIINLKNNEEKGIYFIDDEKNNEFCSFKALYDMSLEKLFELQKKGLKKGNYVLLMAACNKDMVRIFWACILGGIIPIPMTQYSNIEQIKKILCIFEMMNNCYIYTSEKYSKFFINELKKNKFESNIEKIERNIITNENLKCNHIESPTLNYGINDETAMIQFSSGSTGQPKGVEISHSNLISNIEDILIRSQIRNDDVTLSWLPLSHNLGMIGFHLTPLCKGLNEVLIDTKLFLKQPRIWMDRCTKFKVTQTAAPNFGYSFFLTKISHTEAYDWDLSNLRLIYNGAEPINIDSVNAFYDFMERYNLRRDSMYLVYGMAEATLGITFPQPSESIIYLSLDRKCLNPGDNIRIVDEKNENSFKIGSCGTPLDKVKLRIIDDDNKQVEDGKIGNIILKGQNITKGYCKDEKNTLDLFNSDGWMLTGDLGFIYNENVYIVGRKKDMIIINGVNYYSFDIERVCENIQSNFQAQYIACAVIDKKDNDEKLAVFVICKENLDNFVEIIPIIQNEVLTKLGIPVSFVIPTEEIHKTRSGKIQRFEYANEFNSGKYDHVINNISELMNEKEEKVEKKIDDSIIEKVISIIKEESNLNEIDMDKNLSEYGMNSIFIMNIYSRINELIPGVINISDLYTHSTINKLIKYITSNENSYSINIDSQKLNEFNKQAKKLNISLDSVLYSMILYVYLYTINSEKMNVKIMFINSLYKNIELNVSSIKDTDELYKLFFYNISYDETIDCLDLDGLNVKISNDFKTIKLKMKNIDYNIKEKILDNIKSAISF